MFFCDGDGYSDWPNRAYDVLRNVAQVEDRSELEVLLDIAGMTWEEACGRD